MIVSNKHSVVAKEGRLAIVFCLVLLFASFFVYSLLSLAILIVLFFLLYLYRDPARHIPSAPLGIVSPVDGEVISIDQVYNSHTKDAMFKIGIRKNKMGVFAIRSPIEGKLIKQLHEKLPGVSRYTNWVQTDEGDNILWDAEVKGHTSAHCYVQPGERIGHGQRCGFLVSRSEVNLYVPEHSSVKAKIHDRVLAGEGIVAKLIHNQGASIVNSRKEIAE